MRPLIHVSVPICAGAAALQTVIYDLTADKIWVANRKGNTPASDRPYVEFSLAKAFAEDSSVAAASDAAVLGSAKP